MTLKPITAFFLRFIALFGQKCEEGETGSACIATFKRRASGRNGKRGGTDEQERGY